MCTKKDFALSFGILAVTITSLGVFCNLNPNSTAQANPQNQERGSGRLETTQAGLKSWNDATNIAQLTNEDCDYRGCSRREI